ncbi:hypothetical protein T11_1065 [Trichinella zimbabwensis]|uniref:Uncharacterized protein n=1 Tax=Trichinella zimbabwensis TaxID=268475 RepID=A0A0V1GIV1_9BILA|nr:hypothetical protein T11_1065 [Trichinella zimbabwensis]
MRNIFVCRWPDSRPGKAAKNDFLKFLKNAQIFCSRPEKAAKIDFLKFLKDAQSFWLSLARQQARENCKKRLFKIFERCARFLSVAGQAAGPGKLRKTTF